MRLNAFLERVSKWNENMNGLPRKGMLITLTLLITWLLIIIAPLCWPFLLAMLFSMLLEPVVRFFVKRMQCIKAARGIITLLGMLILFGVLGILTFALVRQVLRELISLAYATPSIVRWLTSTVVPYLQSVYQQYADVLPPGAMGMVNEALSSLGQNAIQLAGTLSASLTGGAFKFTTAIPGALLSVVLTIMGTYYMTADRERILAFFRKTFPINVQRHGKMLKSNMFYALFGQVKSQLTVSLIIISFLVLTFMLSGVRYGLLIGLSIGLADALPVIGAGLFLIPWCIFEFIMGNYGMGAFLAAVYIGTIIIRQISEPRIVGANLGLYPLATMIAIYVGFRLFGVIGLLGGPVLLNLLKVVLESDEIARGIRAEPVRPLVRIREKKKRKQVGKQQISAESDEGTPDRLNQDAQTSEPRSDDD